MKKKLGDRIDDVIEVFNPRAAYRRRVFRNANQMLDAYGIRGGYSGASRDRLRSSWVPSGASADEVLLDELSDLRERSRDLIRNDGVAAGALSTTTDNVVGTGLRPQSRVDKKSLGMTDEQAEEFQRTAERIWERWSPYADRLCRLSFWEMQELVMNQILMNGDVIVLNQQLDRPWRPYYLALNVIEADRLATPSDMIGNKNIRKGVEIDDAGEPIAYWICKNHPGDTTYLRRGLLDSQEYIRIPARNEFGRLIVNHLYHIKRPGQSRGEPFFAPVINKFKDLNGYLEAELVAARVCACFSVFIKKENSEDVADGSVDSTESDGTRLQKLAPGRIDHLAPGESIESFMPQRPGAQFDPFVEKCLRFIGAGLGLPYELIFKDFSKTNYSSARAALIEARRFFKREQKFLAEKFCQPTWENLMDEAVLRGELQAENYFARHYDYTRSTWTAPGWGYIDPVKEITAAKEAIKGNISTAADECAAHGKDWEEVYEQRAREEAKRKQLGLPEDQTNKAPAPGPASAAQPAAPDKSAPGQEGDTDE